MKKNNYLVSIILILLVSNTIWAQEDSEEPKSNDDIAKELSNPNTTLGTMAFPIDVVFYNGDLPDANKQTGSLLNFQPSLPIPLSPGVNLFVRPLVPIYLSQPTFEANGFEQKGVNLGNISADVAVGKTFPSKLIGIVGVFGSFRTASDKALRSNYNLLGPELMVAQIFDWGVLGIMFNHAWSLNSIDADVTSSTVLPDDFYTSTAGRKETASITAGQYFYVYNLSKGWQITGQPTFSYNHKAAKGNKFTFPVGTGVNKITRFGKMPIKLSMQYWYYVASPDSFGPQHQIRLQIAPVVPLPW
ncbi:hypothetical protein GZ212_13885 [Mangrovimonas sp. CR14]|uniref:hypothetical protein n=1 Tax=Mangrovimonas sp. CR14 TaxID=2706120 RepID=UPI001422AE14|nr:hypothetical protein [Mangrovimonas sp. CR14]NIK93248.1 hypothetical protein [Mangrovimonas sp. CR14]